MFERFELIHANSFKIIVIEECTIPQIHWAMKFDLSEIGDNIYSDNTK